MIAFFFIQRTVCSSPTDILPRNSVRKAASSAGFKPGPTVDASVIRILLHHRAKVN